MPGDRPKKTNLLYHPAPLYYSLPPLSCPLYYSLPPLSCPLYYSLPPCTTACPLYYSLPPLSCPPILPPVLQPAPCTAACPLRYSLPSPWTYMFDSPLPRSLIGLLLLLLHFVSSLLLLLPLLSLLLLLPLLLVKPRVSSLTCLLLLRHPPFPRPAHHLLT